MAQKGCAIRRRLFQLNIHWVVMSFSINKNSTLLFIISWGGVLILVSFKNLNMKQRYLFFLVFALSLLVGCQSGTKEEKILSVTIEPQRYFLENIVGDRYKINVIVPVGASPEPMSPHRQ